MSECVHDHKGQDDGNKGNGDYGEHLTAAKLRIGTITVNPQF